MDRYLEFKDVADAFGENLPSQPDEFNVGFMN